MPVEVTAWGPIVRADGSVPELSPALSENVERALRSNEEDACYQVSVGREIVTISRVKRRMTGCSDVRSADRRLQGLRTERVRIGDAVIQGTVLATLEYAAGRSHVCLASDRAITDRVSVSIGSTASRASAIRRSRPAEGEATLICHQDHPRISCLRPPDLERANTGIAEPVRRTTEGRRCLPAGSHRDTRLLAIGPITRRAIGHCHKADLRSSERQCSSRHPEFRGSPPRIDTTRSPGGRHRRLRRTHDELAAVGEQRTRLMCGSRAWRPCAFPESMSAGGGPPRLHRRRIHRGKSRQRLRGSLMNSWSAESCNWDGNTR